MYWNSLHILHCI